MIVQFQPTDTLIMKKTHPCGSSRMTVLHAASDVKLRCQGCGHDVIVPRIKIEKNIRQVIPGEQDEKK